MRIAKEVFEKAHRDAMLQFWGTAINDEVQRRLRAKHGDDVGLGLLFENEMQAEAEAYLDEIVASDYKCLLDAMPAFEPYFRARDTRHRAFLKELADAISSHEEEIAEKLFAGAHPIEVLSLTAAGVTYCGAKSSMIIETDVGKFLYKLHPLQCNEIVGELCDELIPGCVVNPKTVDCGTYAFCEYVESVPPSCEADRAHYYESVGGFLAVASFLSLPDQHAGNILPVGGQIAPIDVETMLLNPSLPKGTERYLSDFDVAMRNSLFGTGMLNYSHGFCSGTLVAGPAHLNSRELNSNTEAQDNLAFVEKGFLQGYRACLANKDVICQKLGRLADEDLRVVLVPNKFYMATRARCFGAAQRDEQSCTHKLETLLMTPSRLNVNASVVEDEKGILAEYDIPRFRVKAGGTDLMDHEKVVAQGYYAEPPLDAAIRHVQDANEEDMAFELGLLRGLIAEMPMTSVHRIPSPQPQGTPLSPEAALQEAGDILQRLYQHSLVSVSGARGLLAFGRQAGRYLEMDASLAWGYAGVAAFAAACLAYGAGNHGQSETLIECFIQKLPSEIAICKSSPNAQARYGALGLNAGIAGYLRALQLVWESTKESKALELYRELLDLLDETDFTVANCPTVCDGLAGLLLAVVRDVSGLPSFEGIGRIADELIARSETQDGGGIAWLDKAGALTSGYGKGTLGIALALLRAWQATRDDRYWDACCKAVAFERTQIERVCRGDEKPGIAFGSPGIVVASVELRKASVPGAAELSEHATKRLAGLPLQHCDNLEAGGAAIVEGLIASAGVTGVGTASDLSPVSPNALDAAGAHLSAMVTRRSELGEYIHRGAWRKPYFDPTLFYGATGVGYELLRYASPTQVQSLFV